MVKPRIKTWKVVVTTLFVFAMAVIGAATTTITENSITSPSGSYTNLTVTGTIVTTNLNTSGTLLSDFDGDNKYDLHNFVNVTSTYYNTIISVQAGNASDLQNKHDNYCPDNGCRLLIPDGNYNLTNSFVINKSNVIIECASKNTVIKRDRPNYFSGGINITNADHVTIWGCTLHGNTPNVAGGNSRAIWVKNSDYFLIGNNYILNWTHGHVYVDENSDHGLATQNRIYAHSGFNGFQILGNDITVENNYIEIDNTASGYGIYGQNGSFHTYRNNYVVGGEHSIGIAEFVKNQVILENNKATGADKNAYTIASDQTGDWNNRSIISNNFGWDTGGSCIRVKNASGYIIQGNSCWDTGGHCIHVHDNSENIQAIGNHCESPDNDGINFADVVDGSIEGNFIVNSGDEGVYCQKGCKITDNTLVACGDSCIYLDTNAHDSLVGLNRVRNPGQSSSGNWYDNLGVYVRSHNNSIVANQIFDDQGGSGTMRSGIRVDAVGGHNEITANTIRGSNESVVEYQSTDEVCLNTDTPCVVSKSFSVTGDGNFSRLFDNGERVSTNDSMKEYVKNNFLHALTNGLVALYPLNTDGSAEDYVGYSDGVITSATFTQSGKYAGAYSFDGVDDYINLTDNVLNDLDTGTISFWVKPSELPQNSRVLSKDSTGNNDGDVNCVFPTDSFIQCDLQDGSNTGRWTFSNANTSSWHHYAIVWNTTNIYGYHNGVAEGSRNGAYTTGIGNNADHFFIGTNAGSSNYYNGTFDSLIVSNTDWTPTEVLSYYEQRHNINEYMRLS